MARPTENCQYMPEALDKILGSRYKCDTLSCEARGEAKNEGHSLKRGAGEIRGGRGGFVNNRRFHSVLFY